MRNSGLRVPDAPGYEPGGPADVEGPVVPTGRRRPRKQHQILARQIGEAHFGKPGERRGTRQHHPQLDPDLGAQQQLGGVDRPVHEPRVQPSGGEQPELLVRRHLLEVDPYAGKPLGTLGEQRTERRGRSVRRHTGTQRAETAVAGPSDERSRTLFPRQQVPCLVEQYGAGRCEPHLPVGAVEEFGTEIVLQPPDRPAERRLGHAEQFGGPPEVQLLGDDDENTQVAQEIHATSLGE